jgi:anti-sigma factor RsiW
MDPMEFRLINAYRDGDMKAHRREAKNTALIECVQVAAEKAKWRIRDDFKRMSSLKDVGAPRPAAPAPLPAREPILVSRPAGQQRTVYDRPSPPPPEPIRAPPPPPPPPMQPAAVPSHGAIRFSSVFGGRRR